MGVQGLWQLLEPVGRPVSVEALEGKVLAVDVSIWLNQALIGGRDAGGQPLANAHLTTLFSRICKLLYYGIKPIFVFDGATPELKKQTLAKRRLHKGKAEEKLQKFQKKLLRNRMTEHALNTMLNRKDGSDQQQQQPSSSAKSAVPNPSRDLQTAGKDDLFLLPPTTTSARANIGDGAACLSESSDGSDASQPFEEDHIYTYLEEDPEAVDLDSGEFKMLPAEIQHEIIQDVREAQKRELLTEHSAAHAESADFSKYQLDKLMKQSRLTARLTKLERVMREGAGSLANQEIADNDPTARAQRAELAIDKSISLESGEEKQILLFKTRAGPADGALLSAKNLSKIPSEKSEPKASGGPRANFGTAGGFLLPGDDGESEDSIDQASANQPPGSDVKSDKGGTSGSQMLAERSESPESKMATDNKGDTSNSRNVFCSQNIVVAVDTHLTPDSQESQLKRSEETIAALDEKVAVGTAAPQAADRSFQSRDLDAFDTLSRDSSDSANDWAEVPEISTPVSAISKDEPSLTMPTPSSGVLQNVHFHLPVSALVQAAVDKGKASLAIPAPSSGHLEKTDFNLPESIPLSALVQPTIDKSQPSLATTTPSSGASEKTDFNLPEMAADTSADSERRLEKIYQSLLTERDVIRAERGKQERLASTVSSQVSEDARELISLFGIPYEISPMEAEAQCAELEISNQCQGTITDDSDIWLFGGHVVYRNFFSKSRDLELFRADDIQSLLGCNREKMIAIALLCGSDYTHGLEGVGPVLATEILSEFPGETALASLETFRDWHGEKGGAETSDQKASFRKVQLTPGFPSHAVIDAYREPRVNKSTEKFSWASPDLLSIRAFLNRKLGWTQQKVDRQLLPVMKRYHEKQTQQTKITDFFRTLPESNESLHRRVRSRRLKRAFGKLSRQDSEKQKEGDGGNQKTANVGSKMTEYDVDKGRNSSRKTATKKKRSQSTRNPNKKVTKRPASGGPGAKCTVSNPQENNDPQRTERPKRASAKRSAKPSLYYESETSTGSSE